MWKTPPTAGIVVDAKRTINRERESFFRATRSRSRDEKIRPV
jgi:hypothetical protein